MPKLQAAFDLVDLDQALAIATTIVDAVDIIEAGTVLVIENGLDSVRKLRAMLQKQSFLPISALSKLVVSLQRWLMKQVQILSPL